MQRTRLQMKLWTIKKSSSSAANIIHLISFTSLDAAVTSHLLIVIETSAGFINMAELFLLVGLHLPVDCCVPPFLFFATFDER